jgi:myo-inositol-1-phosphate synthase
MESGSWKDIEYTERLNFEDEAGNMKATEIKHDIKVDQKAPKLGVMLVGWGGNNGSTFTAGVIANRRKLTWASKMGKQTANFFGSLTQSVTVPVGFKKTASGALEDVHKFVHELVPMVNPCDFEITGWDISGLNIYDSCYRAQVIEPTLIELMKPELSSMVPLKAVFNGKYIASNQADRVDNVFVGTNLQCIEKIRKDIREFRQKVDKVLVLWTANTEEFFQQDIKTKDELEGLINSDALLPASVLYAYASLMEHCTFLNGSPQNTLSPAIIELAREKESFVGGSDFKTGQTKFKSIMADFFIGTGLKLASCMSYNHLGNNDGKNLSEPKTFRSKEISKQGVLDESITSNPLLYPEGDNKIDHTVVIKYCPFVGDSKRAMDEYISKIFLNGWFTLVSHATCEDSLLAVPIMYDIVVLAEFFTRVKVDGNNLGPVLSYLNFFFKAPLTNHPTYTFNSFSRQKNTLINLLKVLGGLIPDDSTLLGIKF